MKHFLPILRITKAKFAFIALAATLLASSQARAEFILDLTKVNASYDLAAGTAGGISSFQQTNPQSTGTGVLDSFLRLHANKTEQGFNTDAKLPDNSPALQDVVGGIWTHSLKITNLTKFKNPAGLPAGEYFKFVLDVNQNEKVNISLNQLQLYITGDPALTTLAGATKVYDLDNAGAATPKPGGSGPGYEIQLDFSLNSGSGSGDMFFWVSTDILKGQDLKANPYMVLYSQFGNPPGEFASNDGFEEWAAYTNEPGVPLGVPAPASLVLFAIGGGCCFGVYRRRKPHVT